MMRWDLDCPKLIVGLMSGTSLDGVDAAALEVRGAGARARWRLLAFERIPYEPAFRARLASVALRESVSMEEAARLHFALGEKCAEAALAAARAAGAKPEDVSLIASHGQTVRHVPRAAENASGGAATLQLGCAAVIAERTGATVVHDFRSRDAAAGGEGAPLVPLADFLMFRAADFGRVCLNLGGIANITALPADCAAEDVAAFDTGPGNSLLDLAAARVSGGAEAFDHEGRRAAAGKADKKLLGDLKALPFFSMPPPKSTGREEFGERLLDWTFTRAPALPFNDVLATLAELTAWSVAHALEAFVFPKNPYREIVVSGGGIRNTHLMALLRAKVPLTFRTSDELGVPAQAKEAVAFALLGNETMAGGAGNIPSATGARRAAVLGSVTPGRNFFQNVC